LIFIFFFSNKFSREILSNSIFFLFTRHLCRRFLSTIEKHNLLFARVTSSLSTAEAKMDWWKKRNRNEEDSFFFFSFFMLHDCVPKKGGSSERTRTSTKTYTDTYAYK